MPAASPIAPHRGSARDLQARLELSRRCLPYLVYRDEHDRQVLVELAGRDHLTIGRRAENDVALVWDGRVSRLHAELVASGGEWVLTDHGLSTNGTWVGERRLAGRRRLRDGDLIRVGATVIAFVDPRDPDEATARGSGRAITITPARRRVLVALCRPALLERSPVPPSNQELAAELVLSVDAVKTHLRALYEAFELSGAPQAVKRARLVEAALAGGHVTEREVRSQTLPRRG